LDTNLSDKLVSENEKSFLVEKGIMGSYSANYLVWRRSTLMVIMIPLLLNIFLSIFNELADFANWQNLKKSDQMLYASLGDVMTVVTFLGSFEVLLNIISFIIAGFALRNWHNFAYSKKLVIWSWCIYFFSNFLMSLFPYRIFVTVDMGDIPPTISSLPQFQSIQQEYKAMIGIYLGAYFFLQLAPPSLTLSIAVIRTCLNVRSLFPGSSIPGLVSALIPLIYAPIIWCCFVIIIQAVGNIFLIAAIMLFLFAPFLFICCGRFTFKPMVAEEAHKYAWRLRWLFISLIILSIVLFIIFLLTIQLGALLQTLFTALRLVEFCVSFICEYFFTNVFAADLLITAIALIRRYERDKTDQHLVDVLKERDYRSDQFVPLL